MWPASIHTVRVIVYQWLDELTLLDQCSRCSLIVGLTCHSSDKRVPRRTLPSSRLPKVQFLMHKVVTHDNDTLRVVSKSSYDKIIVSNKACGFREYDILAVVHARDRCHTNTDSVSKAHKGYLDREERVNVVTVDGEFQ